MSVSTLERPTRTVPPQPLTDEATAAFIAGLAADIRAANRRA